MDLEVEAAPSEPLGGWMLATRKQESNTTPEFFSWMNEHPKPTVLARTECVIIGFMKHRACGQVRFFRMLGYALQKHDDEY
jgi:hypothetical protein